MNNGQIGIRFNCEFFDKLLNQADNDENILTEN